MWMVEISIWSVKWIIGPTSEFVGTENVEKKARASESRTNLGEDGLTNSDAQVSKQLKEIKLKWYLSKD